VIEEGIQNSLLPEGPGRRLREARTALKLSRDDVAAALRLKPAIIHALEADDTAALPAPIYVNGYLRNYARLLGIPSEPLIEAYAQLEVEAPAVVSEIVKTTDQRRSRLIVRGVGLLVFFAVLGGFLSWLQHQDLDWLGDPSATDSTIQESEAIDRIAGVEQSEPLVSGPVEAPGPEPVEAPEFPAEEQTGLPSIPGTDIIAKNMSSPDSSVEKQQVSGKAGAAPAQLPQVQQIVMHVNEDCWIELTDAKGRRLVYDLVRAGETLKTQGIAPFRVFLGNAVGVRVEVNGQDYDFSSHIDGNLARFTLTIDEDA
jgi:cytoskeleton protein RodZ